MPLTEIADGLYYLARKPDGSNIFTIKDMLNPPIDKQIRIPEGRFNHHGQGHWYLGDSEELCAHEISNETKELLWMQKFKIKNLSGILDVSIFIDEDNIDEIPLFFSGLFDSRIISKKKSNNISWTPEYFIPRFISDTAKLNGIKGIIYGSANYWGNNLVIFDADENIYEPVGEPYIYIFDRKSDIRRIDSLR
jgi:hypothetical protein